MYIIKYILKMFSKFQIFVFSYAQTISKIPKNEKLNKKGDCRKSLLLFTIIINFKPYISLFTVDFTIIIIVYYEFMSNFFF